MKIVIDIPEDLYKWIHDDYGLRTEEVVYKAVVDGKPYEERLQGEWISHCYQNFRCSICGYIIADSDVDEYNYCPNCGAKIKGGME